MNRLLPASLSLLVATGCASLAKERRLAEPDRTYRVQKLVVLPVMLPFHYCPDDIDKRARKDEIMITLTKSTVDRVKTRGYPVEPLLLAPELLDVKAAHNKELGQALCSGGTLEKLPPAVAKFATEVAKPLGVNQVLITGVGRLRWHLKMDLGEDNGSGGDNASEFDIRAVGALYDIAADRVVWSEYVDTKLFTGSYDDAIQRVLLFDELRGHDPHEKLFYDFPLSPSAPAPR